MRLTDTNTLIETICRDCPYKCNEFCREVKHIIKATTIDAMPVIHAHPIFEHKRNNARCSNCGNYTIEYDMDNWDKYCSHCGAKMDEKDGE